MEKYNKMLESDKKKRKKDAVNAIVISKDEKYIEEDRCGAGIRRDYVTASSNVKK